MGLLEEMGISEVGELSLDELKGKIFEARKKAVLRQNAANTDKRVKAELMMETISEISTMLDSLADDSVDYALLVNTYAYAHDNGQINKDLKEALVKAAQKDIPNIERITEFYRNNGPKGSRAPLIPRCFRQSRLQRLIRLSSRKRRTT